MTTISLPAWILIAASSTFTLWAFINYLRTKRKIEKKKKTPTYTATIKLSQFFSSGVQRDLLTLETTYDKYETAYKEYDRVMESIKKAIRYSSDQTVVQYRDITDSESVKHDRMNFQSILYMDRPNGETINLVGQIDRGRK